MKAIRTPFFTATVIPILLGSIIAFGDLANAGLSASWSWQLFMLVIFGALCAHAGANLANDYGDHKSGNDSVNLAYSRFNGGSRVIQDGLLSPRQIFMGATICFLLTIAIGFVINTKLFGFMLASSPLLWIGIIGCLLGLLYSLGPFRLGYHGAGEVAIAIGFGPIMVLGSHYVLSSPIGSQWDWLPPLLASIPISVFVMLIVWINQFQDVPADIKVSKLNWVVRSSSTNTERIRYEKPLLLYRYFGYSGFAAIVALTTIGLFDTRLSTLYAAIALAPLPLFNYANRLGLIWLKGWNQCGADHAKLPYALLKVNAITIAIHLSTGLLLVLAYSIRSFS